MMQKGLVLVLVKEAVFTEGMKLYFEEWGFEVRDVSGSQLSLHDVLTEQPALIVLDLPARLAAWGVARELLDQDHRVPPAATGNRCEAAGASWPSFAEGVSLRLHTQTLPGRRTEAGRRGAARRPAPHACRNGSRAGSNCSAEWLGTRPWE